MEAKLPLTIIDNQQLQYENELLKIAVLGGVKLEGLDRLRVTLKVELKDSPRPALRHNMDLYNDTQLEKFIRKIAERMEIGTSVIAASLNELTNHLESYRLQLLKDQSEQKQQKKQLSEVEREEAINFLKTPDLLLRTNDLIGKSGVIGEELNRLLMYIIFTFRKGRTPLHVISLGSSGTGKTHLQEKVGELMPEEDKLEITTLSENAFYYFGQRELKNKLILIEDLDGAENVLYPLRELQSKKRISKTIAHTNSKGERRTIHLVVEGPVSVAGCTTQEHIYEDNANRSFLIYLDESKEQDEKIMNYQRAEAAGRIDKQAEEATKNLLQNVQRLLQPIKIINPYAEYLQLPNEVFKPRRTNSHYLLFIEAVTFYHQYQRPWINTETGEIIDPNNSTLQKSLPLGEVGGAVLTTIEDIQEANQLIKNILLRKSDELSGACRNYFEKLKQYLQENKLTQFNNREIRKALRIPTSTQKRHTVALIENYFIKKVKGTKERGYLYEIVNAQEYKELQNKITNVLDETLQNIKDKNLDKSGSGSLVAQSKSEPPKAKRSKVIKEKVQEI
ncbi:MAG: hypothetical protein IM600_15935 [Bacteroidetes bacterium]|nr:hypothetical protein [Bacteroidota bacterium]MCA6444919.1 hypothetical protein [Bacteroidota bacterium]